MTLHNKDGPSYLRDLINHSNRELQSDLLTVPRNKQVRSGDKAFSKVAPTLWNDLPQDIRQDSILSIFQKQLKTLLFKRWLSNQDLPH